MGTFLLFVFTEEIKYTIYLFFFFFSFIIKCIGEIIIYCFLKSLSKKVAVLVLMILFITIPFYFILSFSSKVVSIWSLDV